MTFLTCVENQYICFHIYPSLMHQSVFIQDEENELTDVTKNMDQ